MHLKSCFLSSLQMTLAFFMEHTNLDALSDLLNIELDKLTIWLASNKYQYIDKSHFVIFHRARLKQNNVNISLRDMSLNRVNFTNFLGVIIDDKLSFAPQISYIKNTISMGMGSGVVVVEQLERSLQFLFSKAERRSSSCFTCFSSILLMSCKNWHLT